MFRFVSYSLLESYAHIEPTHGRCHSAFYTIAPLVAAFILEDNRDYWEIDDRHTDNYSEQNTLKSLAAAAASLGREENRKVSERIRLYGVLLAPWGVAEAQLPIMKSWSSGRFSSEEMPANNSNFGCRPSVALFFQRSTRCAPLYAKVAIHNNSIAATYIMALYWSDGHFGSVKISIKKNQKRNNLMALVDFDRPVDWLLLRYQLRHSAMVNKTSAEDRSDEIICRWNR